MTTDKMPELGETIQDRAVALGKGAVGTIPLVGALLAEVITQFIPQQRWERVEDYVARLNARLSSMEQTALRAAMQNPEAVDLFEEGALQTTRSLSDQRRQYIATIVAEGLKGGARTQIEAKRMLRLLEQIDDDQVIILAGYTYKFGRNLDYVERHKAILRPPIQTLASDGPTRDEVTLSNLARSDLERIGLLRTEHPFLKKGEIPEFDRNGQIKGGSRRLTPLGHLLLRHVGLLDGEER
ncbi:MAG: hypothetical protein Q7U20_02040 [Caulobacter sp.]|nr:hypothetical protein [Caulobacter sp.]